MVSKQRSRQLSNAQVAHQYQFIKKPRTDTKKSNLTNLNNNKPSSNDNKPEKPSWYQNNSLDNEISDFDQKENIIPDYNSKSDLKSKLLLLLDLSTTQSTMLKQEHKADEKLRKGWKAGF